MDKKGIMLPMVYLLSIGFICIAVCLMFDTKVFLSVWYMLRERILASPVPQSRSIHIDSDVVSERERVGSMPVADMQHYSLVTKELSKMYRSFCSVNRLSFTVEA